MTLKILYLMHVNWFWIRQRPHVIAELLSQQHQVTLLHYAMYRQQHRSVEQAPPMPSRLVHRIPGPLKRASKAFEWLDTLCIEQQVLHAVRQLRPDCVWVLHPIYERATRRIANTTVVYDCMDDHLEFVGQGTPALAAAERRLVARADLCVFSSRTLAARVVARAPARRQVVVNNAVGSRFIDIAAQRLADAFPAKGHGARTMGYFGTISRWFDWDLVFALLEAFPDSRLELVGPLETPLPDHPRVLHMGVLTHAELPAFAARCQVLLMPFKINRLVESVDPVKLYEYIALGVPALAPRYGESERFVPFIGLYDDVADAVVQLQAIFDGPAPRSCRAAARTFLANNTWEVRGTQLLQELQRLQPAQREAPAP